LSLEHRSGESFKNEKFDYWVELREDAMQTAEYKIIMREIDKENTETSYDVTPEEEVDHSMRLDNSIEDLLDDLLDLETDAGEYRDSMFSDLFLENRYSDSDLEFKYEDDVDGDEDDIDFLNMEEEEEESPDIFDKTFDFVESSLQGKKLSKFIKDLDAGDTPANIANKHTEILP